MKEVESSAVGRNSISGQHIFPMVCDHSCLRSVRKFCDELRNKLRTFEKNDNHDRHVGIDVLCLNAAVLVEEDSEAQYTHDDLELTFQTNHLAPYLIANLTFDMINPGGRIVVTSSGLHAFSTFDDFAGVINPETGMIRRRFPMIDGNNFDYKKSYASSKLCNVAFCLALNRRLQERGAIAISFSPGLIPTSGLFRHQKQWKETWMDETEEWGGSMLAWMVLADEQGKQGGKYWRAPFGISKRGGMIPGDLYVEPICKEAIDVKNQESLWKISAELSGIRSEPIE